MLRLAFEFIITWRETRTRPNAYRKQMSILPVLKVKMESRCNLLTTILYDSFLSFSMLVKDIGPVRVLLRLKVPVSYTHLAHFIEKKSRYEYLFLRAFKGGKI